MKKKLILFITLFFFASITTMSIQILQANDNANFTYSDIVAMAESSHVCNNRDCLEDSCEPVWEPVNCTGPCEGYNCNWSYAEPKEGNGDT